MQHQSLLAERHLKSRPNLAAPDSIGIVTDSVPVHPEDKHPSFDEFKQKNKHKHPPPGPEEPDIKPPDPDHQIDEYA